MTQNKKPRIAIMGAGAIGSLLGGLIARADEDVTLIGRGEHIEAINNKGLSVDGVKGRFTIAIPATKGLTFKPDLIFLAVKAQDIAESCNEIKNKAPDTPVVLMQNGIRSAEIAGGILGREYLISCVVLLNARYLSPGRVSYVSEKPIIIGSVYNNNEALEKKAQSLLNHVARTEISNNITGVQWTKLFMNSMGNALDAMSGLKMGDYITYPVMNKIGVLILKEALAVVNKAKIKMESVPGTPVDFFKLMIRLPLPVSSFLLGKILSSGQDPDIITSTLQSLKRGKKTEIDFLNGELIKLGKETGIPTPYNSRAVELIKTIENTHTFYSPAALAKLFSVK